MDGKELLAATRFALNEESNSNFLDDKQTYTLLRQGAEEFVRRTQYLKSSQSITIVADQTDYTLNHDFMNLFARDRSSSYFIKYYDGTTTQNILFKDYEDILYENNTSSVGTPTGFSIINDNVLDSQVTGTATSTAASSGGQVILTDTAGDFSDVNAGDVVHNTTDSSDGYVLSKTSSTVLVVALFDGTDNDLTSGDAYVIQPQGRLKLVLDPPPSTAGGTLTVNYIQAPAPVYSDYGVYNLPQQLSPALAKYATWLYKYRDDMPREGDALFMFFDKAIKDLGVTVYKAFNKRGLKVNKKARRNGNR